MKDYSDFQPMARSTKDINNLDTDARKSNHLYSNIMGNSSHNTKSHKTLGLRSSEITAEAGNPNNDPTCYSPVHRKNDQQRSALDTHHYEPSPVK